MNEVLDMLSVTGGVLRCFVSGPRSDSEIARLLGVEKSGRISVALVQLVEAGFVSPDAGKNPETGADVRELIDRLLDRVLIHSAASYCKSAPRGDKDSGLQVDLLLQSKMSYLTRSVEAGGYFDAIVPASDLLGL